MKNRPPQEALFIQIGLFRVGAVGRFAITGVMIAAVIFVLSSSASALSGKLVGEVKTLLSMSYCAAARVCPTRAKHNDDVIRPAMLRITSASCSHLPAWPGSSV
jgi:hypothetical protein